MDLQVARARQPEDRWPTSCSARAAPARAIVLLWQRSPAVRWGALAIALGCYAIASLEPFDWQVPRQLPNRAERVPDGWRFAAPGIVVAKPPHAWLEAATVAETLRLSLEVRPLSTAQTGPARILTISRDRHLRNLTLAQEADDLVLRLRTADADLNGLIAGQPFARLEHVFRAADWVAIDLQIRPGELTIAIDGQPAWKAALPPAVLQTWHSAFSLALGNEMSCDRPWLGEVRAAILAGPDRVRDYALADAAQAPATCWVMAYPPALVPFRVFLLEDAVRNTLMYLPLGLALGLLMRSSGYLGHARALLVLLGVSMALEVAQLFVASRFPAIDDVIFNTAGGSLGLALAQGLARRAGRCR